MTRLNGVVSLTAASKRMARGPLYPARAFGTCREASVGHIGIEEYCPTYCLLCFSLFSQEEEIPELEIDIDELLELTDEGQRTRLQVNYANQCKNNDLLSHSSHCISSYFYIQ